MRSDEVKLPARFWRRPEKSRAIFDRHFREDRETEKGREGHDLNKKIGKGTISIVPLSPLEMNPRFSA